MWAAARAAWRSRVPYVLSPRGMMVRDLIHRKSRLAKSAWLWFVERRNLERAAVIHVTSSLEAMEARRFGLSLPVVAQPGITESKPELSAEDRAFFARLAQPILDLTHRVSTIVPSAEARSTASHSSAP